MVAAADSPQSMTERVRCERKRTHGGGPIRIIAISPIPSQVSFTLLPNPKNERQEA